MLDLEYKSQKGNISDLFLIMVVLLGFAISIIVGYQIFTDLNTQFQNELDSQVAKDLMSENRDDYNNIFDNMGLFDAGQFIVQTLKLNCKSFVINAHIM